MTKYVSDDPKVHEIDRQNGLPSLQDLLQPSAHNVIDTIYVSDDSKVHEIDRQNGLPSLQTLLQSSAHIM